MSRIKQNTLLHYGLVLMIVSAVCGLAIGVTNALTAPIIEERMADESLVAYQVVMPGITRDEALTEDENFQVIVAFDDSNNVLGYVYTVKETNQYGDFVVIVGVDTMGEVLGATFLVYEQTPTFKSISEINLSLYVGLNILSELPSTGDIQSGATYSYNSLINAFTKIKDYQQNQLILAEDRGLL